MKIEKYFLLTLGALVCASLGGMACSPDMTVLADNRSAASDGGMNDGGPKDVHREATRLDEEKMRTSQSSSKRTKPSPHPSPDVSPMEKAP